MHATPLIATIVAGLTGAFILGALAQRLRISPLVGYVLAGVLVGPFTPGYVADVSVAGELAEIGVILLMFGVGLHFSRQDLMAVRFIAVPGALAQMGAATLLGMGVAWLLGWTTVQGFVFGLCLSVASTVVLLRALQERRILQTDRGRIAVGWLIVEDLAMVFALVVLPALAGALAASGATPGLWEGWVQPIGLTVLKIVGFVAFMLIVAQRVIPWVLHYIAHTGSRELFRLGVLVIALGVAFGAAALFDVSFALGAFFAGMILAGSELSQRAAEETLPLRDAFAVLFFVSVGMLFNPTVVVENFWALLATLVIIIVGKSVAALVIMRLFRRDAETSLTVAASLAQIGEFSFILAGLGVSLALLPPVGRDLVLAGAIISILLNPLVFALAGRWLEARRREAALAEAREQPRSSQTDHTVVVGYGRVGRKVADGLTLAGCPFLVVELNEEYAAQARGDGLEVILGNAADPRILAETNIAMARRLYVAIPDAFEAGQIVEQAKRANPSIETVGRAHSDDEVAHLVEHGADEVIMGEDQIARGMLRHSRGEEPPGAQDDQPPPAPTPPTRARLLLTDAEHALLEILADVTRGSLTTVASRPVLEARFAARGYDAAALRQAEQRLVDAGCAGRLGPDELVLTEAGLVAAGDPDQAPAA